MSFGGGDRDDDDIRRELAELRRAVQRISETLDAIFTQDVSEEVREKVPGEDLMWDVGTVMEEADTLEEYRIIMERAASSETISRPRLSSDAYQDEFERIAFHVDSFMSGHHNIDTLSTAISKQDFRFAMVEITMQALEPHHDLLVMLNTLLPDPSFYGLAKIDGEYEFFPSKSPLTFLRAYDSYWFTGVGVATDQPLIFRQEVSIEDFAEITDMVPPWENLGIERDPEAEVLVGEETVPEFALRIAETIDKHDMRLSDEFRQKYLGE